MRKLILSMSTSVDGIASDELSWMQPDTDQSWNDFFEMLSTTDLLLLGGGMWEDYKNHWERALRESGFSQHEVKYARYAHQTKHIIFSSGIRNPGWENAAVYPGKLKEHIQFLKSEPGQDIQIVGGLTFASAVMNTGLVDEYRIMMNPVLLGKERSLYADLSATHTLELLKATPMDNGVVVLTYKQAA